jgi:uncharacterized protein (TIGR03083 family)
MDRARLLECIAADAARLHEVAGWNLAAPVPTCPDWTVADLVRHVANGYLNVVVRRLRLPEDRPVQDLTGEQPIAALDRCYAALIEEFAARSDDDQVAGGQETVRFWIRRMAQETAIHRVDAELAVGAPATPIPEDLAVDAVGEMLWLFLEHETHTWPEDYADYLVDWGHRSLLVSAGPAAWRITLRTDGAEVNSPSDDDGAEATIAGEPAAVLLWLYNRRGDDAVEADGDTEMIGQFRRLLAAGTGIN